MKDLMGQKQDLGRELCACEERDEATSQRDVSGYYVKLE